MHSGLASQVSQIKSLLFVFSLLILCGCDTSTGNNSSSTANATTTETVSEHPKLINTAEDIQKIRSELNKELETESTTETMFQAAYTKLVDSFEEELAVGINVPVPADAGGGFTHEQHKRNYKSIHAAGFLYQITANEVYAQRGRDLLMAYADLYPSLPEHPMKKEQSPGRLFWQSLNEAVWLLYSIQGYDALIDALTDEERQHIENNLFRPVAKYLSEDSPQTFDKIHNHGTWAVAAVGMTGYVLGDDEMVEKALYGLDKSGDAGFLKQMDELFSPDGYYTEGPYYQRYALMPFVLFAKAIDNNDPERKIFQRRDEILMKAIYATIQLSYNKLFFPINDALKDKGLDTTELVHAVAIAYGLTGDPALLSVARTQGRIDLSGDGFTLARDLEKGLEQPFPYRSMQLSDGASGDQGALSIIRSGYDQGHQTLLMKNTSQGMGHGHFDKLGWMFYDNNHEIVTDYGAARFLNVESKYGGHYLPENKTWARQTIAHNTLVVDEKSHFNGKLAAAEKVAPVQLVFDVQDNIQISSAKVEGAYPDVSFVRTMAMISNEALEFPIVLDVLRAKSEGVHQYDLPVHYQGHIVNVTFPYQAETNGLNALGESHGYQHLWVKAKGQSKDEIAQVTWLKDNRFYTNNVLSTDRQEFIFTELGANDPDFNLRPETAVIQRISNAGDHSFVSILETHGEYNPVLEYTRNSHSQIANMSLVREGKDQEESFDLVQFEIAGGKKFALAISYNGDEKTSHSIEFGNRAYNWTGRYHFFEGQQSEIDSSEEELAEEKI